MGSPLGSPNDVETTGRAVREMFAAVAYRYDFLNHFLSLGRDIAWRRATARTLGEFLARPGSVGVDVCCGTGDLAFALKRVSGGTVIGTDFCHPMLRLYVRQLLPRLGTLSSGVRGPYPYRPDSVSRCPDQQALAGAMRAAGFTDVRYRDFTGGVAALHIGQKELGPGKT